MLDYGPTSLPIRRSMNLFLSLSDASSSKMMINLELHASWDQPIETIVFKNMELGVLQSLALVFVEKAGNLIESNEKVLDSKSEKYGHRDPDGNWKVGDRAGRGGRGGAYHGGRGAHNSNGGRGCNYNGARGGRSGNGRSE